MANMYAMLLLRKPHFGCPGLNRKAPVNLLQRMPLAVKIPVLEARVSVKNHKALKLLSSLGAMVAK